MSSLERSGLDGAVDSTARGRSQREDPSTSNRRATLEQGDGAAAPRVMFLITTTDFGGTETALLELVRGLPTHGIEPIVCTLCAPGHIGREIASAGTRLIQLDMDPEPSIGQMVRGVRALARIIDHERIDLVQTLLYRANTLGGIAARIARCRPALVSSQRSIDPGIGRFSVRVAALVRRFADVSVAVSDAVCTKLMADENVSLDRIVVIPNGVDAARYARTERRAAREALGLDTGAFIVGGAGRLSPAKGFHDLIEAGAIARRSGAGVHVAIAGDGPAREDLQAQARRLGVLDHVTFVGTRRDLATFYSALDVFALPSLTEGSPNALLEAMGCGCACVATRVGGVPEIVDDGANGLLVAAGAPEAFARALVRTVHDDELRRSLAAAARTRVLEHFTIAETVRRHAELYRRVLSRHNGAVAPQ